MNIRAPAQRNKESAELLTKLAIPQIKPGPSVEVQKKLASGLEKLFGDDGATEFNLGGILIDTIPDSDQDLIGQSQLAELPRAIQGFISSGAPRSDMVVKRNDLGSLVVENTLRTMIDAGQVDYLRKAGLPNEDWKTSRRGALRPGSAWVGNRISPTRTHAESPSSSTSTTT